MVKAILQKHKDFAEFNFATQTLSFCRPKRRQEKNYRANAIKNSLNLAALYGFAKPRPQVIGFM